jgi:diguanylate cyclase (GGDEF)-like protein
MYFDSALHEHFSNASRSGGCLAVIFCDLDHFKPVNDTHGHQAGDRVLVEIARRMIDCIGDRGVVARYGGEEFAIILPETDRVAATEIAEQVRQQVCAAVVALEGTSLLAEHVAVTMSLGVAAFEPALAKIMTRPEQLLKVADQAVYAAKNAGRNCVRTYKNRRVHSTAA